MLPRSEGRITSIRDLLPFDAGEVALDVPREEFIQRLHCVVRADSMVFVNYWTHKGEFVGKVANDRFRIRRFIRTWYVPLILGRLTARDSQCLLRLRFLSIDAVVAPIALGMLAVFGQQSGAIAAVFAALVVVGHVFGCVTYQLESGRFLRAVGIAPAVTLLDRLRAT